MRLRTVAAIVLALPQVTQADRPWKDPLAMPAPPSSVQRKWVDSAKQAVAKALPEPIKQSIGRSKAQIDKQVLGERAEALDQLGIKKEGVGYLTILVSASMPQVLLNGYAQSAVWAGGVVDFRGITVGQDIGWFVTHVMRTMVRSGSSPTVSIDPRAFSAYGVTRVPAIIYSTQSPGEICDHQIVKQIKRTKQPPLNYHDCAPVDPTTYWKMTGAVSVAYALRQFVQAGAPGAKRLLRAVQADPLSGNGRQPLSLDTTAYGKATGPGSISDVLKLMNAPVPEVLRP